MNKKLVGIGSATNENLHRGPGRVRKVVRG